MKENSTFIIVAIVSFTSLFAYADGNTPTNPGKNILKERTDTPRPNSLQDQESVIICHINNNIISFELPQGIESISINIYNDTEGWMGFVTRSANRIMIPYYSGSFYIDCYSQDNRMFSGIIQLD